MSVNHWMGDADEVAQVHTFTVQDTWAAADTATLTCGRKSITYTSTGSATAAIAAGLVSAWNASEEPELTEVTASSTSGGSVVSLTADTAGLSFVVSASENTAGDGTVSGPSTGTANSGPNCWNVASNWSLGTVPTSTDNVRIEDSDVDILYGLTLSCAPATIDLRKSYTGNLGLARTNTGGYVEYRETELTLASTGNATTIDIGKGDGDGASRIRLDLGNGVTSGTQVVNVHGTAATRTSGDYDVPCVLINGSTGGELNINKGDVGLAFYGGDTATFSTVRIGYISNKTSDARLSCGSDATLTTIYKTGGQLEVRSNVTTLTQHVGRTRVQAGTLGTANVIGGTLNLNSTGAPTTINLYPNGTLDYRENGQSKGAPTDVNMYQGAALHDPAKTVTWNANINLIGCGNTDVTLDVGKDITISAT